MANTQYSLHLKGYVGGADFDRNYVDYVLGRNVGKPVSVLIDSLGGSVATALSIASAFRNHADVSVHFVGMNASAATIASLGARHIRIDANAMYLVHKCSSAFFEWGSLNADQFATLIADCEKIKADLDKLDLNIASMYSAKCKKDTKDLLDLMQKGGWLSAKDALDWGFVDEITDLPEEAAPELTDAVASEMAAAGMPIPNIPIKGIGNRKLETDLGEAQMPISESQFPIIGRFLSAIASLFAPKPALRPENESQPSNHKTQMPTETTPDPRIAQLEADVAQRDKTIGELQEQIASLNAQVADLKKAPGDESKQVVDADGSRKEESPLDGYYRRVNNAKAMFNALP